MLKTDNLNEMSGKETKKQISFDDSVSKSDIPPEEKKELAQIIANSSVAVGLNGDVKNDLDSRSIETLDENANIASQDADEVDKKSKEQEHNDNDHEEVKSKADDLRKLVEAQQTEKDHLKIIEESDKSPVVKKVSSYVICSLC